MTTRIALTIACALLLAATFVAPAAAATAPAGPELDAETVQTVVSLIEKVDIGSSRIELKLKGSEPIVVDYGEALGGEKNAKGLGYMSFGALALTLLSRLGRTVRVFRGLR